MDTLIIKDINDESMEKAGEIIREGGLVAFPTETVYGLGASAFDDEAVKKIYKAKGRPSDNPLIVHIAEVSDVEKVAREVPEVAKKILDKFAPGPFTVILKKRYEISDTVTAGLDTVGVRIPRDKDARAFLKVCGVPVAAPSANLSGKPSPTCAEHVIHDMKGRIDAIICGGTADVGVESTIIDLTCPVPTILRPGGITKDQLEMVCGEVAVDRHVTESVSAKEKPKCPGMKYKHYAPDADVTVVEGDKALAREKITQLIKETKKNGKKVGVLASEPAIENADMFIGAGNNNKELAKVLFSALRSFDDGEIDVVYVQFSDNDEYALAVKNRLYKSAGNKVIHV